MIAPLIAETAKQISRKPTNAIRFLNATPLDVDVTLTGNLLNSQLSILELALGL